MTITLIQPNNYGTDIEPPKGLASLAAYLDQRGYKVRLIDLQIERVEKEWEKILTSESTSLVGITATTQQMMRAGEIAKRVKALLPDTHIILGGVHCTVMPEQTLDEFPLFEVCVIGEGEETLLELASRAKAGKPLADESVLGIAFRSNGKNIITPRRPRIKDLDLLPIHHDYYDFDFYLYNNTLWNVGENQSASLIVSRGCPYNCHFCATRNFWSNKALCKSVDGTLEEIRYVLDRGARGVRFRDSTFGVSKKWVRELCTRIIKEKLEFDWTINSRVDLVDYDLFKLMKKAGLVSVFFGVESGSQRILDIYNKQVTVEQTINAFKICRKLRIHTGAYWMLGLLPETREDMEATYQLGKKVKADQNIVFIFMPLPGCELYQYYIDQGCEFDYDSLRSDKALFENQSGFTLEELTDIRTKWFDEFNARPNVLVRGINSFLDIRSFKDVKRFWKKIANRLPGSEVKTGCAQQAKN